MRQAGTIPTEAEAIRFVDYLFAQGIPAKAEAGSAGWAVWVRDEEHVTKAIAELDVFLDNPSDSKYAVAHREAKVRRDQIARREDEVRRNFVDMSRRWDGRGIGPARVTMALVVLSLVVAFITRLGGSFGGADPTAERAINLLSFTDYEMQARHEAAGQLWDPLDPIRHGQVWRLVTPIFLHFSLMHLLFNMYMFYQFGLLVEGRRGPVRFSLLVLAIAVISNFGQYYFGGPTFGGMSGVLYGLFGYAWMKSRFEPQAEIFVHPNTVVILMAWFVLCAVGLIGNIANWAHGAGLAAGMVIGIAPYLWRRTARYLRP
jgi:GlpG protein